MIKTQVQLPDDLYREAMRIARERESSLAQIMGLGLEYMVRMYPPLRPRQQAWTPPPPRSLGRFRVPEQDWRSFANDPSDLSRS
ncbi:MAG: antitoxin [Candidatus Thiosymbion ectosymbiont of Robbea hypermnestra]|nr:antitoxin [Candidatus Thiosymbion ectosymbiont of Robbea hypermnestra]